MRHAGLAHAASLYGNHGDHGRLATVQVSEGAARPVGGAGVVVWIHADRYRRGHIPISV